MRVSEWQVYEKKKTQLENILYFNPSILKQQQNPLTRKKIHKSSWTKETLENSTGHYVSIWLQTWNYDPGIGGYGVGEWEGKCCLSSVQSSPHSGPCTRWEEPKQYVLTAELQTPAKVSGCIRILHSNCFKVTKLSIY